MNAPRPISWVATVPHGGQLVGSVARRGLHWTQVRSPEGDAARWTVGAKLNADSPNDAGHEAKRLFSQDTRIFAALVWPLHIHYPAETGLNALPGGARHGEVFLDTRGLAVSLLGLAGVSRADDFDS